MDITAPRMSASNETSLSRFFRDKNSPIIENMISVASNPITSSGIRNAPLADGMNKINLPAAPVYQHAAGLLCAKHLHVLYIYIFGPRHHEPYRIGHI